MVQSDTLSRQSDLVLNDNDNEDIILLPNNIFIKLVDLDLQDKLKEKTMDDEFFGKALLAVKEKGPTPICLKLEDWTTEDGLLFYLGKCYVLED